MEEITRSGEKCIFCNQPLRRIRADNHYGSNGLTKKFKWQRKLHKKCVRAYGEQQIMLEEIKREKERCQQ